MTQSLRGRLLIGVVSLVAVGLVVSSAATYFLLQNSLFQRIDDELARSRAQAVTVLGGPDDRGGPSVDWPAGTVLEELTPDGTILKQLQCCLGVPTTNQNAAPVLPHPLPSSGMDTPTKAFTVTGTNGVSQFRIIDWPENFFGGNFVVLAFPLTDTNSTLSQLLLLEGLVSLAVIAGTAIFAWLVIRLGLRPLQRMEGVAEHIAAGDLSRRVEPATPRTEIGRLGLALNGMLSQIEAAFAERTQSNSRLRRFIADASHELRTPLTSIRGYSEMLRRGAAESPEDAELARRRIEEEAVRMSALVDDMLLIARLDQGRPLEMKPVDLQAIARDAAADARAVAPQREITLEAPAPVTVDGDDTRLRQVLGNLVRNALVHTPPRTPVEIGLTSRDGHALMTVADHGAGLQPDQLERIFEPFYRADPSRSRDSGGAGLGLSIVQRVVQAHGGHVSVRATEGGGATFEVDLPLAA